MRELEEKCRAQSEQFRLLSRDLHKFRQHAAQVDLLGGSPGASTDVPSTPSKPLPQLVNGLAPSIGTGKCLDPSSLGRVDRGWPGPLPSPGMRVWRLGSCQRPRLGRHRAHQACHSVMSPAQVPAGVILAAYVLSAVVSPTPQTGKAEARVGVTATAALGPASRICAPAASPPSPQRPPDGAGTCLERCAQQGGEE